MRLASQLVAVALVSACACSSGGDATSAGFPRDPYVVATSDSGALRIEVRTAPTQPPPRGTCTVELFVADPNGAARDGLTIDVVPWMPAMGHGTSVKPTIRAQGQGRYVLTDVSLFMPGTWELRAAFSGPVSDHARASIQIL